MKIGLDNGEYHNSLQFLPQDLLRAVNFLLISQERKAGVYLTDHAHEKQPPLSGLACYDRRHFYGFNLKTKDFSEDAVIKNMYYMGVFGSVLGKKRQEQLKKYYHRFKITYEALIQEQGILYKPSLNNEYKKQQVKPDCRSLIKKADSIALNINSHIGRGIQLGDTVHPMLLQLLAYVFAICTLKYADALDFKSMESELDLELFLFKPHPVQVISLFRMLGLDEPNFSLKNHLLKSYPKEGKSTVLAILACVLALLGMEVTYAHKLHVQASSDFDWLFYMFGIKDRVHHVSYPSLAPFFLKKNAAIDNQLHQLILRKEQKSLVSESKDYIRSKILLMDDIESFFQGKLHTRMYNSAFLLKDSVIKALMNAIWKNRSRLSMKIVQEQPAYKHCKKKFKGWEVLLDSAIEDILIDISRFASYHYEVKEDKIYPLNTHDNLVDHSVLNYLSMLAYYYEHDLGRITQESLEEAIGIIVSTGRISYVEIPKSFNIIFATSHSLEAISHLEKEIISNEWGIKSGTEMPSINDKGRFNKNYLNSKKEHLHTVGFFSSLNKRKSRFIRNFLFEKSHLNVSKIICLLDATASMSCFFPQVKHGLIRLFDTLFTQTSIQTRIQMQCVAYRNYDAEDSSVLEVSDWISTSDELERFTKSLAASNNAWQGNEAVEMGFWHVNQQIQLTHGISQVLLIGDAAPHTRKEIIQKEFKSITPNSDPVYYEDELKKINLKNIPVHTFSLRPCAAKSFSFIAQYTGGNYVAIDLTEAGSSTEFSALGVDAILTYG